MWAATSLRKACANHSHLHRTFHNNNKTQTRLPCGLNTAEKISVNVAHFYSGSVPLFFLFQHFFLNFHIDLLQIIHKWYWITKVQVSIQYCLSQHAIFDDVNFLLCIMWTSSTAWFAAKSVLQVVVQKWESSFQELLSDHGPTIHHLCLWELKFYWKWFHSVR